MKGLASADSFCDPEEGLEVSGARLIPPPSSTSVSQFQTMKQERHSRAKAQILIVDREPVFRMGLRRLFGAEESLRVLAEAENEPQAIHLARQLKPDLIFFQAEMIPEKAADLVARLRAASPGCRVVVAATSPAEGEHLRLIRAGASGVILKSVEPDLFIKCAHKVMEGEVWLPKQKIAEMARQLGDVPLTIPRPVDMLTHREKMIISYLVQGWRNREIAQHLAISEQTVKNHLRAVYDKVGVSDRLELALYVIYQRLDLSPISPTSVPQEKPSRQVLAHSHA
jgi:two-component system, NarL family, nitrate/nitrite response regulator NarL